MVAGVVLKKPGAHVQERPSESAPDTLLCSGRGGGPVFAAKTAWWEDKEEAARHNENSRGKSVAVLRGVLLLLLKKGVPLLSRSRERETNNT